MDRFQVSQPPRAGPPSRQMGYPNQMPPQQRPGTMTTNNPMMGRLPNGRAAGVPSWGTSSSNTTTSNYATNPINRPPSSGPFGEVRKDIHQPQKISQQSFREDDFPVLGAGTTDNNSNGSGSYANISNATLGRSGPAPDNQSFDDFPALPGMLPDIKNGPPQYPQSSNNIPSSISNANLQQHRSSLLGAMTQGRSTPTPSAPVSSAPLRQTSQDARFGRAINAPPNLSLMSGPPALGGSTVDAPAASQLSNSDEPSSARSTNFSQHNRDRAGDLSAPVPSHAPGLSTSTVQIPSETIEKAKEQVPIEENEPLTETERYTIKGLLPIIRQTNADASMLALGSDLTNLGLKLSPDDDRLLSALWSSPWSDNPTLTSPPPAGWAVPSCYTGDMLGVLPPASLKIGNFAEETLFYIFYTQPRDRLQEHAAQELTARNWRFHKSLGLWLTKEPGVEPQLRTGTMERGTYVFWDSGRWERIKKVFELYYEDLEDRFSLASGSRPSNQPVGSASGATAGNTHPGPAGAGGAIGGNLGSADIQQP